MAYWRMTKDTKRKLGMADGFGEQIAGVMIHVSILTISGTCIHDYVL